MKNFNSPIAAFQLSETLLRQRSRFRCIPLIFLTARLHRCYSSSHIRTTLLPHP